MISMRYDLKKVMTRAHEIKRQDVRNVWSECLKMAWAEVKLVAQKVKCIAFVIKDWFIRKNWTQNERYCFQIADSIEQVRETEKAVDLKIVSKFGTLYKWVPKSCIEEKVVF